MKNSLKEKLFILFVFLSGIILSQNETNNWYFGQNAGMNFENETFTILNDGSMNTTAGCSSISDRAGNLMFYTNGESVWNRNHTLMDNGNGLAGVIENNQSSIIIPKPGDENTYYIFTTRENATTSPPFFSAGIFYSTIEFSAQNPLGVVATKNQRITEASTERLTAVHHTETNSIRVIGFGALSGVPDSPKDTFSIITVTDTGVDPTVKKIQQLPTEDSNPGMKISPDGKFIALLDFRDGSGYLYLFDFDNDARTITFKEQILVDLFFNEIKPYSVEFSADSKTIFFNGESVAQKTDYLFRYFLFDTGIFSGKIAVSSSDEYDFGTLQLARNGKIYMANSLSNPSLNAVGQLTVINDPENRDNNNDIVPLSVDLESGNSFKGLPNYISSFFRNRIIAEDQCEGVSFEFSLDSYAPIQSASWDFGDGSTSTEMMPTHTYLNAGDYVAKATIMINGFPTVLYKDITVHPLPVINPGETIFQCDVLNNGESIFNLNTIDEKIPSYTDTDSLFFYNSYQDALNDINPISDTDTYENSSNPQELFVKIVTQNGCESISNFFIEAIYEELGGIIATMYVCEDSDDILNNDEGLFNLRAKEGEIRSQFAIPDRSTLTFYQTLLDAQTETDPLILYSALPSTTIWVRVENENSGCGGIEPIELVVNTLDMNLEDTYTICDSNIYPLTVLDGGANNRWEWRDENNNIISTGRQFQLNQSGTYSLTVYKTENQLECSTTKEFIVNDAETPSFTDVEIDGRQVTVSIEGESDYEFSLDNIIFFGEGTNHIFSDVEPGVYTIFVRDKNNCETSIQKAISLIHYPKFLTPNGDGYNDSWRVYGISDDVYSSAEISIFDRYGKNLYNMTLDNNKFGWDGTLNGEMLLSTDYWFKATLVDKENNIFTRAGHFSLRN